MAEELLSFVGGVIAGATPSIIEIIKRFLDNRVICEILQEQTERFGTINEFWVLKIINRGKKSIFVRNAKMTSKTGAFYSPTNKDAIISIKPNDWNNYYIIDVGRVKKDIESFMPKELVDIANSPPPRSGRKLLDYFKQYFKLLKNYKVYVEINGKEKFLSIPHPNIKHDESTDFQFKEWLESWFKDIPQFMREKKEVSLSQITAFVSESSIPIYDFSQLITIEICSVSKESVNFNPKDSVTHLKNLDDGEDQYKDKYFLSIGKPKLLDPSNSVVSCENFKGFKIPMRTYLGHLVWLCNSQSGAEIFAVIKTSSTNYTEWKRYSARDVAIWAALTINEFELREQTKNKLKDAHGETAEEEPEEKAEEEPAEEPEEKAEVEEPEDE